MLKKYMKASKKVEEEAKQQLIAYGLEPEEFAARIMVPFDDWKDVYFFDYIYADPQLDEWIRKVELYIFDYGLLREAREKYLSPEELKGYAELEANLGEEWAIVDLAGLLDSFPAEMGVPNELSWLASYQNEAKEYYSGGFSVAIDSDGFLSKVSGNVVNCLGIFGHELSGSLYGIWDYGDRENRPVVYIDIGSDASKVVANNIVEFLGLLAVGYDEIGDDELDVEKPNDELKTFRKRLKKELGVSKPWNPLKVMNKAKDSHPDFKRWLSENSTWLR